MRIDYSLTARDVVEFYDYALLRTREFRRKVLIGRLSGPPLFFFWFGLAAAWKFSHGDRLQFYAFLILPVIISVIWVIGYRSITRDSVRKKIRKMCEGEQHKKMLGEHELCVTPDEVVEKSAFTEVRVNWCAVENIVETDEYIYFFVNPLTAFIVPKEELPDKNACDELVATARKYKQQADTQFRESPRGD